MEYKFLKTEVSEDGICILKISSPHTLNALNSTILKEIDSFISQLSKAVRVLIITGDGNKSFVAGADISEMLSLNENEALDFAKLGSSTFKNIEDLNIPVIAAVNGYALGGGCELSLACDIRIASENAIFGQPEVKLGIIPGFSGTYRLSKIIGQAYAKEIIYTGTNIDAKEALRIGLVNHVLKQDELLDFCLNLARKINRNAPFAVKKAKESINKNYDLEVKEAILLENKLFSNCFKTNDQKEGMNAFIEKRKAFFTNE